MRFLLTASLECCLLANLVVRSFRVSEQQPLVSDDIIKYHYIIVNSVLKMASSIK